MNTLPDGAMEILWICRHGHWDTVVTHAFTGAPVYLTGDHGDDEVEHKRIMDVDMDDERRSRIESRCAAATPGPWTAHPYAEDFEIRPIACGQDHGICSQPDAEFIAHAREDIPVLLAEINKLRDVIMRISWKENSDE
jgi:hypothetical protein